MSIPLNNLEIKQEIIAIMPPTYKVEFINICGRKMFVVYPFVYSMHNVPLSDCVFVETLADLEKLSVEEHEKDDDEVMLTVCPHCNTMFAHGKGGYQVNDIFEIEFCSFHCSNDYTAERKPQLLADGYTQQEIDEGI